MTQAFGGRVGQFPTQLKTDSVSIADAAGDDRTFTLPVGWEGFLDINKCFLHTTTTVAADTTDGTVVIKKNSTVIGTYTSTDGDAADQMFDFVPASGFEAGVNVAAGDSLTVASTQATDSGTALGGFQVYIHVWLSKLTK